MEIVASVPAVNDGYFPGRTFVYRLLVGPVVISPFRFMGQAFADLSYEN